MGASVAKLFDFVSAVCVGSGTVGSGTVGSGTVGSGTVGSGTVGSGTVGSGTVGSGAMSDWALVCNTESAEGGSLGKVSVAPLSSALSCSAASGCRSGCG
ncbi:MAG: hypothetical protein F9B45_01600 [Phycisphaera sp. RhM]|nr:hypothetical protein [Phycisphaera sp. RhM]